MNNNQLQLCGITKSFENTNVLKGIDLSVDRGEFITLLGASGCGKTTTLRIIAGLETPDEGRVFLSGEDVTDEEPNKRDVNTVFQNYALFPHMNVEANIGYSLRLKRRSKNEIKKEVGETLELVRLSGFEKRMPWELSGGQRQRVAIARAIINKPKVLLLDEPLGALDLQLRRLMQTELKKLQQQLGITFIYITHDQEEALNMSDRIAVMRDGYLEQTGTASEIYDQPRTAYVARFVGNANILTGKIAEIKAGVVYFHCGDGRVSAALAGDINAYAPGDSITVAVRGENIEIYPDDSNGGVPAEIIDKSFAGGMLRITAWIRTGEVDLKDTSLSDMMRLEKAEIPAGVTEVAVGRHGIDAPQKPGQRVWINWLPENAVPVTVT